MSEPKIPRDWVTWCTARRTGKELRKRAILQCLKDGCVRGYFSDFILNPSLDRLDSMYPSLEHLNGRQDSMNLGVECRVINEMKTHLTEKEFWMVVEHLFSVGVEKGKIRAPYGKRLPRGWSPAKNFTARPFFPDATAPQTCHKPVSPDY